MRFSELTLLGAFVVEPERLEDERGFFARTFCEQEFSRHGLETRFRQSSVSFNARKGTVRGLHFQASPHEETKLVRCLSGAIYDVIVDLRRGSPTYLGSAGVELDAHNRRALYIPPGFAHGFQTLQEGSELLYMISLLHVPGSARGIRWNDSAITVTWPEPVTVISERDLAFPDWIP